MSSGAGMLGRRVLLAVLVVANLVLLYRIIFSDQGMFAYMDLQQRYERLETRLEETERTSLELSREIRRLKEDPVYQERVVRERLNYVGEDEVLYIFPDSGEATEGTQPDEQEN